MKDELYGLVIAGGAGTRLWPLSRGSAPKQLLPLSRSGKSLLQDAFGRLARNIPPERILTVTNAAYAARVSGQLREIAPEYPRENLLAEPIGKDSGPAILWGALRLEHLNPRAIAAVVWADQAIGREEAFDDALLQACRAVEKEGLAIIGVPATRPLTNLGYIRKGEALEEGIFRAEQFIEKPDFATAEKLVAEGKCLWNPGVFVFKVSTLLEEFERHAPEMTACFRAKDKEAGEGGWADPEVIAEVYGHCPKDSIDYAVLEKTDRLVLLPRELDWSDLGTWDELHLRAEKDEAGNAVSGRVVALDTRNSYVRGSNRLIALVGVEDLVVVDTGDALLICNLKRVQDVKQLVERLKENGFPEADGFAENIRPWGSYTVLAEGEGFKVKVLEVKPRQKLSLQMHRHRSEHWVVVEGRLFLTRDGEVGEYSAGDYFFVPREAKHRIENRGDAAARLVEVQQGSYLGEDDIVRFEDSYGRK